MKILLTGKPGVGKSTVIQNFIRQYSGEKYGVVINRMKDEAGINQGFEAVTVDGRKQIIAHRSLIESEVVIGNGHKVSVQAIESFVVPELLKGLNKPKAVIIIDEIGRMQAVSKLFLDTVRKLFSGNIQIVATIVSDPEPWAEEFKQHPETILIEVTQTNRDQLVKILISMFQNNDGIEKLKTGQKEMITYLIRQYLTTGKYIQINKLLNNAVGYVADGQVKESEMTKEIKMWVIEGKHGQHMVKQQKSNQEYECDCDLFNGRNEYKGQAGECSHIQAVKLFSN